jgi:hypothetical protein
MGMPVLLKPEQFDHWLSGDMGVEELKPVENGYLQRWAVSKRVNSSKADSNDPTLIEAVKQAASFFAAPLILLAAACRDTRCGCTALTFAHIASSFSQC